MLRHKHTRTHARMHACTHVYTYCTYTQTHKHTQTHTTNTHKHKRCSYEAASQYGCRGSEAHLQVIGWSGSTSLSLPPCRSAQKPRIQRVNHGAALCKWANEAIFGEPNPYDDGQGCWNRCGPAVISCQPHSSIYYSPLTSKVEEAEKYEEGREMMMEK